MIRIEQLTQLDGEVLDRLNRLYGELSGSTQTLSAQKVENLLSSSSTKLIVALENESGIVGMLSLAYYSTLQGGKYWIEDVATLPEVRGRGVGRMLVAAAVKIARKESPEARVWLTSNPRREAARALYRSMGFEEYQTGVFRL
ncbi:MAG: GNAT family N-acetyltransferase [Tidjanibacter sp.]|nr:GNAT family N-acetyltransferase [Tidjanibacter sp.]